jgi:hypothetical protein
MKRNKDKGKKVADEVKRHAEKMKSVGFEADQTTVEDNLTLRFSLSQLKDPKIVILAASGNFFETHNLSSNDKELTLDTSAWDKGDYIISLKSLGIPDIGINVTKG